MPLNVFQQVFLLSLVSNFVSTLKKFDLEEWQIVWGPVIWRWADITLFPDNTWFVAYHPHLQFEDGSVRPTYVISIAGTPILSMYAWLKEDLGVLYVTDFEAWVRDGIHNPPVRAENIVPGGAYIAQGTVDAVHTLLTKPAPDGAASVGKTLLDFIADVNKSPALGTPSHIPPMFIATGHSLGGSLSPALGFALALGGHIPKDNVLTYPIAGPTPGDVGFSDLFSQTLPVRRSPEAASYQGWNLNLVNTRDPIPQAWCSDRKISETQTLHSMLCKFPLLTRPVMLFVLPLWICRSRSSGVKYKPLPSQYFTGTGRANLLMPDDRHVTDYGTEAGISLDEAFSEFHFFCFK